MPAAAGMAVVGLTMYSKCVGWGWGAEVNIAKGGCGVLSCLPFACPVVVKMAHDAPKRNPPVFPPVSELPGSTHDQTFHAPPPRSYPPPSKCVERRLCCASLLGRARGCRQAAHQPIAASCCITGLSERKSGRERRLDTQHRPSARLVIWCLRISLCVV
ncbi:hypothetical protein B0T16DRAFT_210904 [Cercophora newfieldiana]|uniref:Uncharacterized protein n=1 Tax=Cercophora newfieldiana TaxID=92897 RepID=A0AA39XY59_9PEZI|nr:hypothetical protein B0T16DRAFT_210904 [Cercophora newfieldiana]